MINRMALIVGIFVSFLSPTSSEARMYRDGEKAGAYYRSLENFVFEAVIERCKNNNYDAHTPVTQFLGDGMDMKYVPKNSQVIVRNSEIYIGIPNKPKSTIRWHLFYSNKECTDVRFLAGTFPSKVDIETIHSVLTLHRTSFVDHTKWIVRVEPSQ